MHRDRVCPPSRLRRNVHNRAASLLAHLNELVLHAVPYTSEIHRVGEVEILSSGVSRLRARYTDACDRASCRSRLGYCVCDCGKEARIVQTTCRGGYLGQRRGGACRRGIMYKRFELSRTRAGNSGSTPLLFAAFNRDWLRFFACLRGWHRWIRNWPSCGRAFPNAAPRTCACLPPLGRNRTPPVSPFRCQSGRHHLDDEFARVLSVAGGRARLVAPGVRELAGGRMDAVVTGDMNWRGVSTSH